MVNLYVDIFSPYYRIRGNVDKFTKLQREYFRLADDIKEQMKIDVDDMSDAQVNSS